MFCSLKSSIRILPSTSVLPSIILMSASALTGTVATSMSKSFTDIAGTVSFGNETVPLMSIGTRMRPKFLVAMKVLAFASTSMCPLCSWMSRMSSPIARVSRPMRPATNRLSICMPMRVFDMFLLFSLPFKVRLFRSIMANTVSLLSVYTT